MDNRYLDLQVSKVTVYACIKEDTNISDEDNQEPVRTHFRTIKENNSLRRSSTKFERINHKDNESSDDDTD